VNRLNAVCLKVQSARVLRTCGTRQGVAHGGDDVLNAQNKPYQDLMEAFLRPGPNTALDLLPLGLYRRHDAIGENYWFVLSLDASSGLSCLWMHQVVCLVSGCIKWVVLSLSCIKASRESQEMPLAPWCSTHLF